MMNPNKPTPVIAIMYFLPSEVLKMPFIRFILSGMYRT